MSQFCCLISWLLDVFESVQAGDSTFGVIPLENSTNGAVVFTLEALTDRHRQWSDITVCGEAYLDVSHYLLGNKKPRVSTRIHLPTTDSSSGTTTPTIHTPTPEMPRTAPRYPIDHVKRILSHPQAFGQCEIFLGAYLKGAERIDADSTSRAAELVKEDTTGTSAAIASKLAAEVHDLDILAQGIEDKEDNMTRFLIIRKGTDVNACQTSKTKTLISFTVDHSKPGALATALKCFEENNINLTSINERPTKVINFQYIFFVEFEGSKLNDPTGRVGKALVSLGGLVQKWRWLGSWDDKLVAK